MIPSWSGVRGIFSVGELPEDRLEDARHLRIIRASSEGGGWLEKEAGLHEGGARGPRGGEWSRSCMMGRGVGRWVQSIRGSAQKACGRPQMCALTAGGRAQFQDSVQAGSLLKESFPRT